MDKKKEKIINCAAEAYKRFGIRKTTVEDIAKECHMATSALYYYFKNKDEITKEVFTRLIDKKAEILKAALEELQGHPAEQIRKYIEITTENHMQIVFEFSIDMHVVAEQYEVMKSVQEKDYNTQINILISILKQGVEQGLFCIPDFEPIAIGLYAIISSYMKIFIDFHEKMNKEQLLKNISAIVLKGLECRK